MDKLSKAEKAKQNKKDLIDDFIWELKGDIYGYEDYILDLVRETLEKRTQKELKYFLKLSC